MIIIADRKTPFSVAIDEKLRCGTAPQRQCDSPEGPAIATLVSPGVKILDDHRFLMA